MPFKSKAQARYMFAKHPEIAKEFAAHTKSIKALPSRLGSKNSSGTVKHNHPVYKK